MKRLLVFIQQLFRTISPGNDQKSPLRIDTIYNGECHSCNGAELVRHTKYKSLL